jgi:glycosyltransferase involved in cell wall biosynthesis
MRTKRILSVQPVAERGGSDHALMRMCRYLVAQGWEFHVVFPETSPMAPEFLAAGAKLHVVPMRRLTRSGGAGYFAAYAVWWPISVLRLWFVARKVRPGVVHSNSIHSWYGWAVAWLLGAPHVWHAREIVVQSRWALRVERYLARRFAWRVVAVSAPVAAQFDGSNVAVVHDALGPEDGLSPERAGNFRAGAGIADDVLLIGAAGRLDTWKGFDVLLGAFPAIRRQRPDVELVVAGGPVRGKEAYAAGLAATAQGTEGVHWLGPRTDMADFMADLDLFVLPSTEPEPFASSALEALASGTPLAATDHGGSPEMLRACPDGTGKLFRPRDPGALVEAVIAMLPAHPSSAARRRARPAQLVGDPAEFSVLFEEALVSSRKPWSLRGSPGLF